MAQRGQADLDRISTDIADELRRKSFANWLSAQRWYADKGRSIVTVSPVDVLVRRVNEDFLALCVVDVAFTEGRPSTYFLPLASASLARVDSVPLHVASLPMASLVDATELEWFGDWLLGSLVGEGPSSERWLFRASDAGITSIQRSRGLASRQLGTEQSNSSVKIGDSVVVKIIRRLQPGPNPDVEVTRALGELRFPHVPEFIGTASWQSSERVEHPIAMAQRFVPNHGDGWSWFQRQLKRGPVYRDNLIESEFEPQRTLGARTAELHAALASVDLTDFLPISSNAGLIGEDIRRTLGQMEAVIALLQERASSLPESMQSQLPEIVAGLRETTSWIHGFREEEACLRIRVHGDYHLGQVLRTREHNWSIIDFEGEPARPVVERRQRASAMKDVAGMLRSFSYARGVAEMSISASDVGGKARLAAWESGARNEFIAGYRETIPKTLRLVPSDDAGFTRALRAWELDKAIYEIAYEIRNRPNWAPLPLAALLPHLADRMDGAFNGEPE